MEEVYHHMHTKEMSFSVQLGTAVIVIAFDVGKQMSEMV